MKIHSPHRDRAVRSAVAWASTVLLSLGTLLGSSSASAAPPANTFISNLATASYVDGNGANQQATSNAVQTQVQQVGSFTLDAVSQPSPATLTNTKTGASGNTVYAPHTLTNTGNGTDSFNIVVANGPNGSAGVMATSVYADADGNGLPDSTTALCSAVAGASCTVPTQTVAGNGGVFKFVVAYSIPGSAAGTVTPYSSATITATPVAVALYSGLNTSASNSDNVNLTTDAAFNATLSLAIPTVFGPGGTAYPAATQSGKHSLASAGCLATMTAARTPAAGCVYSTYTLNFSNTGGAPGVFYANNALPTGFTYVAGSAVWSGASGTAMGDGAGGDPAGIDFAQSGQNLSVRIVSVAANVSGSISFMVQVNATATVGTGLTSNNATYDSITSVRATANATVGTTTTNTAAYTVTSTYGVVLGSATGTSGTSADTTPGTPLGATGTAGSDRNVAASITSGGVVKFTQNVFNIGDSSDTFNLSVTSTSFPAGSNVTYYNADGATPLLDTNGDGIVDTGIIAAGGTSTFVVQVQIPATAAGSGPYALTVLAKSANDLTQFDASGDQVTIVTGILLDLTNTLAGSSAAGTGDLGAGPSTSPTVTNSTAAGTGSIFSLFIRNGDTVANTYTLSVSQAASFPGSLPAGWTVKYVAAGATCAGTAMAGGATTASIAANNYLQIDACVTPAPAATAGTTSVYFQVASVSNASTGVKIYDTLQDSLTVTAASTYTSTLTPSNNGQVSAGSTVVYAHTLTNTGAQACTAYNLTATQSGAATGWSYAIHLDANGNGVIDAGDTPVSSGTGLAAGGTAKYLVRVFAPGGSTPGQNDTVTFTVTFTEAVAANNCGTHSVTDTSTVVLGQIRAYKTQALNTLCDNAGTATFSATTITGAKPGQCITYKVLAVNEGSAFVTNLKINDAVPNYTSLAVTQPGTPCNALGGITGTTPLFASAGSTVSCGTAGSVPPSGNLTLMFTVKIDQ